MKFKLDQFRQLHIYMKLKMLWPSWPINQEYSFDSGNGAGRQEEMEWLKVDEK